jgi:16S rRNA A1518/A1519 N6-dimethyltransferase RsmA/KsgA/DIM1 with predicted DNA glycosylase/AP lyase activity
MITLGPITPKKNEFQDDDLVCYCFEYTKKNIEEDFKNHGYSKILEKIKTEKKNKGCNCEVKNPKGK